MFYTHPVLERPCRTDHVKGTTQAWKIVSRTSLTEWFYITHIKHEGKSEPHVRMVQIDDAYEFHRFISGHWSNVTIGEIYLVSPVWTSDGSRILTWQCNLLLEMKRFCAPDAIHSRYSYLTDHGMRFSDAPDGSWDCNAGELIYRHSDCANRSLQIPDRETELRVYRAKQVIDWACELFRGDVKAAAQWLHTPLPELDNRAPCDITSANDDKLLNDIVDRLEQSLSCAGETGV